MEKIDFKRVKKLNKILNPKIMGITPDPGLEEKGNLFFYNGRYYFANGLTMKKLSESEADEKLSPESLIKIHFLCSKHICPMPGLLSGKQMESKKVADDSEAAQYMTRTSKVLITSKDL